MDNGTRLIGLAMTTPEVVFESARAMGMKDEWLVSDWQQEAWRAMNAMLTKSIPIDLHFVSDFCEKNGYRIARSELEESALSAPSKNGSCDALIQSIREEYVRRELDRIANSIPMMDAASPVQVASNLSVELMNIAGSNSTQRSKESIMDEIKKQWRDSINGNLPGIPMPWSSFLHKVGGPRRRQVTTVVGHGGSGKSSMFLQWAMYLGNRGIPSLVLPFEDGVQLAYERLAGMAAEIPIFSLHIGRGNDAHMVFLEESLEHVSKLPIYLSDRRGMIGDIQIEVQQYKARHDIQVVFVDSFKDIARSKDGVEADGEVMAGLVNMAHRLDIPVVVGHHVRKAPSSLKGNSFDSWHINKDDLRGSGRIWDDSRVVMALQMYPNGEEKFDYYFHQLKSNHGIAGVRQQIVREPWMCWREVNVIDSVST